MNDKLQQRVFSTYNRFDTGSRSSVLCFRFSSMQLGRYTKFHCSLLSSPTTGRHPISRMLLLATGLWAACSLSLPSFTFTRVSPRLTRHYTEADLGEDLLYAHGHR